MLSGSLCRTKPLQQDNYYYEASVTSKSYLYSGNPKFLLLPYLLSFINKNCIKIVYDKGKVLLRLPILYLMLLEFPCYLFGYVEKIT